MVTLFHFLAGLSLRIETESDGRAGVACRTFRGAPEPSAGGGLQDALGWLAEADEAVQDAWLRVSRLGVGEIDNLSGQNPACLSAESQQNRGATDY
jgi:hypothetical protein